MADPLSISASIAGLITITDTVFSRTFKYVKAVKGAPNEVSSLTLALGALSGILHNLHLVASQLEGEPFDTAIQVNHIHSCIQTVEKVEKILDKFHSSSARPQNMEKMKRLKWPFSVSEAKTLCAEIERHKTTLSLALNVDGMTGFLQTLSRQKDLQNGIDDIKSELRQKRAAETRITVNKGRRKVLDWIQPYDPHQNHDMSLKLRHPGTGLWLIESDEFKSWLSCSRAKLWCYGIPGAGKTVLASSVIQEALGRSSPKIAVAFFYCDYKNATTQDPRNILGSLACQFAVQDEQSFGKLQAFYAKHDLPDRSSFGFSLEELRDLLIEMASSFNSAMIVVDALDECGTQNKLVTRLLFSLNDSGKAGNIKTLFLSRDEQEIREVLEGYDEVSIAARSSDLRLFVGAEIELRTRNKDLRIKDNSLKQDIMDRLVEGADGMFRWVACQMDHLCELPNDAARRKTLNTLPPTLHATYERILQRVNRCSKEVQQLVQRSLRWLVCSKLPLSSSALCEAVSINTGDTTLDRTAIPGEDEVLRWCSSLVRRSASGKSLELAHFTVKEFLTSGIDPLDCAFGVYHFGPDVSDGELAETCLTYLSFKDFALGGKTPKEYLHHRLEKYAFRFYAVRRWAEHARKNLTKPEVWSLTQHLLHPLKPLVFLSWAQDLLTVHCEPDDMVDLSTGEYDDSAMIDWNDLATANPLHFAAMLALPEACEWLLQEGCLVDQSSEFGTPLQCALVGDSALYRMLDYLPESAPLSAELGVSRQSTVKTIIGRGADVQKSCFPWSSPFNIAVTMDDEVSCTELLRKGATIDCESAEIFDYNSLVACEILKNIGEDDIRPEDHAILLESALRSEGLPMNCSLGVLVHRSESHIAAHVDYLSPFLTAAEYGQLGVLKQLFRDHKLGVDATGRQDQRSALHLAASNDHVEIVRFLQEHGADCTLADSQGRTPLHASVEISGRYLGLQFLLGQNVDVNSIDKHGLTAWHLAASQGNTHALGILKSFAADKQLFPRLKASDGRTLLHCATQSGSIETLTLLLNHSDKYAIHEKSLDGSTALHYAVQTHLLKTYSSNWGLDALEVLLTHGADPTSQDPTGGTVLTYLVENLEKILIERKDDDYTTPGDRKASTTMISKILDSTNDENFLANVCTDPHLLFLALIFGEEELVYKVLKYSPSVDATAYRISRLSSLQATCYYERSSRQILEELLGRSKFDHGAAGTKSGLLLCACNSKHSNRKETVMNLLDLGLNPNECSVEGTTAMMLAAERGHTAVVEILVRHGADVFATDNNGWSVIHYACRSGSIELLHSLKRVTTDWNASITAKIHDNWCYNATALHLAASLNGYALEFLLENDLISDINSLTHGKETALWIAALFGISRNVSLLLDKDADDTIQAFDSEPPLHAGVRAGSMEVVMVFINKGCNLLLQDGFGFTPELVARKYGRSVIANVLRKKTSTGVTAGRQTIGKEKTRSPSALLKLAIELGDIKLCQALLEEGVSTDRGFSDFVDDSPVLRAFAHGQLEIVEYLIANGASIAGAEGDASIYRGYTPFHYAASAGNVQILRILFDKAPRGILRCCQPVHPIHLAIAQGHAESVELIIDHARKVEGTMLSDHICGGSYDLDHVKEVSVQRADLLWSWRLTSELTFSKMELTTARPLHIAAALGHVEITRSLIDHGASVDGVDDGLWTPLHFAAKHGQTRVIEVLIHSGANVNAVDDWLETPCIKAASYGFLESIQALIEGGADLTVQDLKCRTALYHAAYNRYGDIVIFLITNTKGYVLNAEAADGESVLALISWWTNSSYSSFFLNLAPNPSVYEPRQSNVLTVVAETNNPTHLKMLLRRLPKALIPRLLAHRALVGGTPLYAAATRPAERSIAILLAAGADLELEGGEHGTPLMGACAAGRLEMVKALILKGAKTSYTKEGQTISAISAARLHPKVRRWLLVGRFMEGPLLIENGKA